MKIFMYVMAWVKITLISSPRCLYRKFGSKSSQTSINIYTETLPLPTFLNNSKRYSSFQKIFVQGKVKSDNRLVFAIGTIFSEIHYHQQYLLSCNFQNNETTKNV